MTRFRGRRVGQKGAGPSAPPLCFRGNTVFVANLFRAMKLHSGFCFLCLFLKGFLNDREGSDYPIECVLGALVLAKKIIKELAY